MFTDGSVGEMREMFRSDPSVGGLETGGEWHVTILTEEKEDSFYL